MSISDLSTQAIVTPEMFSSDPSNVTTEDIISCLNYAKENNVVISSRGSYLLSESITIDSVKWIGGQFSGNKKIYISNSTIENTDFNGPDLQIKGGACRFLNNKIHGQASTAAFLIKDLESSTSLICTHNEFFDCNYAILQQGTGSGLIETAIISNNIIHDIKGDAIELNVVNKHYKKGLLIEGNIINAVDGSGPNWGIGIGLAGKGPYDVNATDDNYASNFTIKNNYISGCRQCIHTEICRDFTIINNTCYPDTSKSTSSGIISGAYVSYGCKRFTINGLSGEPDSSSNRFIFLDWGNNSGTYAAPPTFFTIKNVDTIGGNVEVFTAGSDHWDNTTIIENIRCNKLLWRGLPSLSIYRNIFCTSLDCIGNHSSGEGSGGGIYTRLKYICSQWVNVLCLNESTINVSIKKMYVDKLIESGNNFTVPAASESNGHRGVSLSVPHEEYLLNDDDFPVGREFSLGCQLWKLSGGYFRVTKAGASLKGNEMILPVTAGAKYIQTANHNWAQKGYLKSAGTRIIIPGAGADGKDLETTIVKGTYILNNKYTLDISPAIQTTLSNSTLISAAYPVEYIEVS